MLLLEAFGWLVLGIALAVGRSLIVGDPVRAGWLVVGSAVAAGCAGALTRLVVVRSVTQLGLPSEVSMFAAVVGASLFLIGDWLWNDLRHHHHS